MDLLRRPSQRRAAPVLSPAAPEGERIALYIRLARIFRDRIAAGLWQPGALIPRLPALCEEFGVSRVTMRQALALLAEEGLIGIAQGRGTWVTTDAPARLAARGARDGMHPPPGAEASLRIEILGRRRGQRLPAELASRVSRPAPQYTLLRKRHLLDGRPFVVLDAYATPELLARFPPGAEKRHKLGRLLREALHPESVELIEEITLGHADRAVAEALHCGMGDVTVRIRRWYVDSAGQVPLAAVSWYRAEGFALEIRRMTGAEMFPPPHPAREDTRTP